MKRLALLIATAVTGLAVAAPAHSGQQATLTIRALGIYNMPIYNSAVQMDYGPFWHFPNRRPGQGRAMAIGGHDVTPVPGYGAHGPFYNLVNLKKGYLVEIRWRGKLKRYRFVSSPFWRPEWDETVIMDRGMEAVWFYTCWPRYTHTGRLWIEAVLIPSKE